jgi:undecaprenyl-diphosphatase
MSVPAESSGRRWWLRAGAWYLAAFLACLLAGWVIGVSSRVDRLVTPDSLDVHVLNWVRLHRKALPNLTRLLLAVTRLGDPLLGTAVVAVSAAIFAVWERQGRPGIRRFDWGFWLLVNLGARLLTLAIKTFFQRPRPPLIDRLVEETSFSFPSGHSLSTAAFFTVWVVLFCRAAREEPRWVGVVWIAIALLMTLAIGGSRVWLTVHYFSDVCGGLLLGMTWASLCCLIHYTQHPPRLDAGSESTLG